MNLQESQPQPKPQPIRFSMEAPSDQLYKLVQDLNTNEATRKAFNQSPEALLLQFGMELNEGIRYEMGKKKKKHDDPHPEPPSGDHDGDSDAEVVAVCVAIASDVVVGALICGVLAVAEIDSAISRS